MISIIQFKAIFRDCDRLKNFKKRRFIFKTFRVSRLRWSTQWRVSHFQSFVAKRMQQICTNYNEDTNRLPFHNDGLTLFWLTMTKSSLNASVKTSPPFIRNKIIFCTLWCPTRHSVPDHIERFNRRR